MHTLKSLREALCDQQTESEWPDSIASAVDVLISMIDSHRPLASNGKHGDLHTPTCGCDDIVNQQVRDDRSMCATCATEHDDITWTSLGMLCARCGQHTGNNHQGHYWGLCKVLVAQGATGNDAIRELHFCCPGDCELEAGGDR